MASMPHEPSSESEKPAPRRAKTYAKDKHGQADVKPGTSLRNCFDESSEAKEQGTNHLIAHGSLLQSTQVW